MKNVNSLFLIILFILSCLLISCGTSNSDSDKTDNNSTSTDSSDSDSSDSDSSDSDETGSKYNDKVCFGYISKDTFKKIFKEKMTLTLSSYNGDSCKFKSVSESETKINMVLIDQLDKDKAYFLEQKKSHESDKSYTVLPNVKDDAYTYFDLGWMKTKIWANNKIWYIQSYAGSSVTIPELDNDFSADNQKIVVAKKIEIAKQLAAAFKSN